MRLPTLFKSWMPNRSPSAEPRTYVWFMADRRPAADYGASITAASAMAHPVAYRCIAKIADAVSSVTFYARPVDAAPAVQASRSTAVKQIDGLLRSPNNRFSMQKILYWLALHLACHSRAIFVVGADPQGIPNAIYPLDLRYCEETRNRNGIPTGIDYGSSEPKVNYPFRSYATMGISWAYDLSRMSLTPDDPQRRTPSALGAVALPMEMIRALLQRGIDTAFGHPNTRYAISTDKPLTNHQRNTLENRLDQMKPGQLDSSGILVFEGVTITVSRLDNDLSDLHSKVPLDDAARMIAGNFGVPVALLGLGAADAAKYASNYQESRIAFWQETIIPSYLLPIASELTAAICPEGVEIVADLDSIEALADARLARGARLVGVDWLTDDEKRSLMGFEPMTAEQRAAIPAKVAP